MIVVIQKSRPGVVFAYHFSSQEADVKSSYSSTEFSAYHLAGVNVEVGGPVDVTSAAEITLG